MTDADEQNPNVIENVAAARSEAASDPAARLAVNETPVYDGRGGELFPIVLVNLIFSFLTVGLYRFWAKTRVRGYLLSRVAFLGDRFEYTGTGKELFVGFLVVVAVLIPVGVAFNFLGQYALGRGPVVFTAVQTAYFLLFYLLFQFAVYRAQRYRMSRTTWRGIRGAQAGSAIVYARRAMLWSAITLLTLGLAYPLMRRALLSYKINNARFGDESLRFEGGVGPLYTAFALPWAGIALMVLPLLLAGPGLLDFLNAIEWQVLERHQDQLGHLIPHWKLIPVGLLLYGLTRYWYRAAEVRHFTNHTGFDELRFTSNFRGIQLFLIYAIYSIIIVLLITAAIFITMTLVAIVKIIVSGSDFKLAMTVFSTILFALAFLVAGTLQPIIVQNFLIRVFCNNLTIRGSFSPEKLLQNQMDMPRRGEGLADALDIDAF